MTRLFSSKINILKVFQIEPWSGEIHQGNLEVSNKQTTTTTTTTTKTGN